MNFDGAISGITWELLLLCGFSLCVGWGIRGNFGHEYGAAIPGALAAVAMVLIVGRPDWLHRVHYFAMFGAIGWSFGGSMSYMQVVGYTHSSQSATVLYGYANLFVIGFLWAAIGGAGTALPALLSHEKLTLFFTPMVAIFIGWSIQAVLVDLFFSVGRMRRHESRLYWYDTDWLAAVVATVATVIVVIFRGQFDIATTLILHIAVGWFIAFLLLVNLLKLRMTPPRGDNWAGCVGMVIGVLVYCWRYQQGGIAFATLMTGFLGGLAFSGGQLLKLLYIRTGLRTNWHSVMEQTQGLLFGLGLAVAFGMLSTQAPEVSVDPNLSRWTGVFAVCFVLVGLTYLNHRKAAGTWIEQVEQLPEKPLGLPVSGWLRASKGWIGWFELIYLAIGIALAWLLIAHLRHPLAFIPESWLGKGQWLYLIFLWWVVIFNFERALVGFSPHRLVTEGVITFNAVVCTLLVALGPRSIPMPLPTEGLPNYAGWIGTTVVVGLIVMALTTLIFWGITYALYGGTHAPDAALHIRFGPNATATKAKPKAGAEHP